MDVLIFDIWGSFAHFKKFYATSSPLTFSFLLLPTIKGMLGAIVGCDKGEYLKVFSKDLCKVSIQILKPIKKIRLGLNHINTKDNYWRPVKSKNHGARTQIPCEFLKDPRYRMYVNHKDPNIFGRLVKNVKEHKTFFTLSLGLSELLGDFEFIDLQEFIEKESNVVEISSVVPISVITGEVVFQEGFKYYKERIPLDMNPERVVEMYEDVIYEVQGRAIKLGISRYWEGVNEIHVVFF